MVVFLKNERNGHVKKAVVGFSWTTFFFGWFVPLFRADFKIAIPWILLSCIYWGYSSQLSDLTSNAIATEYVSMAGSSAIFMFCMTIFQIVMAFIYNKVHAQGLINKRYYPMSKETLYILKSRGVKIPDEINEEYIEDFHKEERLEFNKKIVPNIGNININDDSSQSDDNQ